MYNYCFARFSFIFNSVQSIKFYCIEYLKTWTNKTKLSVQMCSTEGNWECFSLILVNLPYHGICRFQQIKFKTFLRPFWMQFQTHLTEKKVLRLMAAAIILLIAIYQVTGSVLRTTIFSSIEWLLPYWIILNKKESTTCHFN